MRTVLVTGADGFIGRALVAALSARGSWQVRSAIRSPVTAGTGIFQVEDLTHPQGWDAALAGCDAVVHLAAIADARSAGENRLWEVNVEGTLALARRAAAVGVGRFLFMSSAKAMGEATPPGNPFTPESPCRPEDSYGRSKLEAEIRLRDICEGSGLAWTILRPPLVYGPETANNFRLLMKLVASGMPLPFASVRNRRSLIAVGNLVDLTMACLERPAARGRVLLASDGEDLSTAELLVSLRAAMGTRSPLLPVPPALLRAGLAATGRKEIARRLLDWLQLDIGETRRVLSWAPPLRVQDALAQTALACRQEATQGAEKRDFSR